MSIDSLMTDIANKTPQLLEAYACPGVAVAILQGDETFLHCDGMANLEESLPVTAETLFHFCSISKAVATWGVMRLVDEGKLDLDTPVDDYLSRWHLPPSEFDNAGVTVRRLLSHTAGLPVEGYTGAAPGLQLPTPIDILEGRSAPMDERQVAYSIKWGYDPETKHEAIRVKWPPGEKFSYSGGGYVLLDLLVEEVTGKSMPDYLAEAVLAPLGLDHASFHMLDDDTPNYARCYDESLQRLPLYRQPHFSAGSLSGDIRDLARFVRAEFARPGIDEPGQGIISPTSFRTIFEPVAFAETAGGMDFDIGLGHFLGELNGRRLAQHSGGSAGWRSIYFVIPETGQGFAALINGSGGNEVWQNLVGLWVKSQLG
ncbi:MAG: serine hydrolase domain-containing protein [Pseudomonadota bacterium]